MQYKIAKYLFDIQVSIYSIDSFIGENKDFNEYVKNKLLRRAVEREFQIIGEAITNLKKIDNEIEVSFYRQIIGLRNQITHSYDSIDDSTIWGIVINHLPVLKKEIDNLLNV